MAKANSLVWSWLSLLVIICDQITKNIATEKLLYYQSVEVVPGLNMTLVHNTGAAFSFLSQAGGWQRWFFIVLTSTISLGLVYWLYTLPRQKVWLAAALSLVLGGALGNLWDRVKLGYVIDFIDVYYQSWHWPAFNVADSCICIGAGMLIVDAIWFDRAEVTTHNKS
ncbi:MAG: lipoprotein signal peptidase [Gammaproteobacteria bacterium]|nr:lipoprotein signal peptidase [Gammaproteobacteria bacterium]